MQSNDDKDGLRGGVSGIKTEEIWSLKYRVAGKFYGGTQNNIIS